MNCSFNAVEQASIVERSVLIMRAQLLARLHHDNAAAEKTTLLDVAKGLGDSIVVLDDALIAEPVFRLIDSISAIDAGNQQATFTSIHGALDLLATIEERLLSLPIDSPPTDLEIDDLFDRSIVGPIPPHAAPIKARVPDAKIDLELLDIFRDEAEDLLRNIESCLNALAANTGNETALWEIRRHAHTFKGSAAIVGFLRLSDRAHAIEDLIESFANQPIERRFASLAPLKESFAALRSASVSAFFENESGSTSATEPEPQIGDRFVLSIPPILSLDQPLKPQTENGTTAPIVAERLNTDDKDTILRLPTSKLEKLDQFALDLELSRRSVERESERIKAKNEQLVEKLLRLELSLPLDDIGDVTFSGVHKLASEIGNDLRIMQDRSTGDLPRASVLRAEIEELRMVEFGTIKGRLERTARVTAEETNKQVALKLDNESALIDAHILAKLTEPLLHLIRNAVVHGLESGDTRRFLGKKEIGTIFLSYARTDTHLDILIRDDGSGIDKKQLMKKAVEIGFASEADLKRMSETELQSLIFEVGLSTADSLTMNAGRGVGMSIVKRGVDSLGGAIRVSSIPQTGTEFAFRIPHPKQTIKADLFRSGTTVFAIPTERIGSHSKYAGEAFRSEKIVEYDTEKGIVRLAIDEPLGSVQLLTAPRSKNLEQEPGILGYGFEWAGSPIPIIDVDHVFDHGLPFIETPADRESTSEAADIGKVLVVDDSPSARARNVKIIERQGFSVVAVSGGIEALNWLAKFDFPPVLLVTDIEMPEMSGFELIKAVRRLSKYANLPIIIVSSRNDDEHQRMANKLDVVKLLKKPVDEGQLIAAVRGIATSGTVKQVVG